MTVKSQNYRDEAGNPAGGCAVISHEGYHFTISFQDGPIQEKGVNGVQVDDLLEAAVERLHFLNDSRYGYECEENHLAIQGINIAIDALALRTRRRTKAGTEGYNRGN